MFANSLTLPQFDYLDIIWCRAGKHILNELDVLYKKAAKIALDYDMQESSDKVYRDMKWLPLHLRRQLHLSVYMYKIITGKSPPQFMNKFPICLVGQGMVRAVTFILLSQEHISNFVTLVQNVGIYCHTPFDSLIIQKIFQVHIRSNYLSLSKLIQIMW